MDDLSTKIETARKAGYNDDEIIKHLSSDADLGPKIKQATDAGYSSADILGHIAPAPQPEKGFLEDPAGWVGTRLKRGTDQMLEGYGETASQLGAPELGQGLKATTEAPAGPSDFEKFLKPTPEDTTLGTGYALNKLPGVMVEQAPQLAASIIGRPVAFASEFAQQFGPMAKQIAERNGRTEPNAMDWLNAGGGATASGILNAVGIKGLNKLLFPLKEAATEGLQSAVTQSTTTGKVDPHQAVGEAIAGGVSAAPITTVTQSAKALRKLNKPPREVTDSERRVANAMDFNAADTGLKLTDLTENQYENEAQTVRKNVQKANAVKIRRLWSVIRPELQQEDNDALTNLLEDAEFTATKEGAMNERKNVIGESEIRRIKERVGHTVEGREFVDALEDSNTLTRLSMEGASRGLLRITEAANPISKNPRNLAVTIGSQILSHGVAPGVGGFVAPAVQGLVTAAGRGIDRATGYRGRPLKRFVDINKGDEPDKSPLPSILADRARSKLADLADRANAKQSSDEAQQARRTVFESLYQMQRAGTITPDDIETNKASLTQAQYKLFYDNLDKAKAKAESDALKRDRDVVRQGEIMGKQRDRENSQDLKDLTTGMRMTARGRAQASAQESQQAKQAEEAARAIEAQGLREQARQDKAEQAAAKREDKATLDATLKEGTDLANSGGLSEDWLTSNRDRLSPSQYASFAGKLARQQAKAEKAAEKAKAPAAGKAPRAPRVVQPKAVVTEPAQPTETPFLQRTENRPPQTFIEHPEAWQRKVDKAERIREEINQTADLAESSGRDQLAHTLRVAVEALDTMKREKRNIPKKRERKIEKLRDTLDTAEDQTMFEDVMAPFRDLFTDELTLKKALKKIRKARGMTEEEIDVPF